MAKVLLVEDKSILRNALRKILERSGHDVFEAADCTQGAEICRTVHADIVVTDMVSPIKNGIEMLTEFKRDFPTIPVIAMSGGSNSSIDFLASAKECGAHQVLTKPFFPNDLIAAINGAISGLPRSP